MTTFLTETELKRKAPSVFATQSSSVVSDRYGFIPTIDIVRGLAGAGFYPVKAFQTKTRIQDKKDFARHLIRFRHQDQKLSMDSLVPEIVMINSHDGSSAYQLRAGIYRFVCGNGMIVGNDQFCRRIKHNSNAIENVVESAKDLIEVVPISVRTADEWSQIQLTYQQKVAFAESALQLKWDTEKVNVNPERLINPRRYADTKDDLWTTFNVIQEHMIKGGIHYVTETGGRQSTRAVNSVNENVRLNTALWTLTEKMAELTR